jgi:hypothetical protein
MTKMNKYCHRVNCVEHLNDEANENVRGNLFINFDTASLRESLKEVCFVEANIDSLFDAHL